MRTCTIILWTAGTAAMLPVDTGRADTIAEQAAMLSPDESVRLELVPSKYGRHYVGGLAAKCTRSGQTLWTFSLGADSVTRARPQWIGKDVFWYAGGGYRTCYLVRIDGKTGRIKWRNTLRGPMGHAGGADVGLPSVAADTCIGVIDFSGAIRFYELDTGRAVRTLRPTRSHRGAPKLADGMLTCYGKSGAWTIRLNDWLGVGDKDVFAERLAAARAAHARGQTAQALTQLDELIDLVPEELAAWKLRVVLCEAIGQLRKADWSRAMVLTLSGEQADEVLARRRGLVRVYRLSGSATGRLAQAGRYVCVGTQTGELMGIDRRTWKMVTLGRTPGPITTFLPTLPQLSVGRSRGGFQTPAFTRAPAPFDGQDMHMPAPDNWIVRGEKHYIPMCEGILIATIKPGEKRRDTTLVSTILPSPHWSRWAVHIGPSGTLGYGPGGIYTLDETYNPVAWRLKLPVPANHPYQTVSHMIATGRVFGMTISVKSDSRICVYDRQTGKLLRGEPVGPLMTWRRWPDFSACGGGFLHANGSLTWIPATAGRGAWSFGPCAEAIHAARRDNDRKRPFPPYKWGFGRPLVAGNHLFVSNIDLGCVYVFDLGTIAALADAGTAAASEVTYLPIEKVAHRVKFVLHVKIKEARPSRTVMTLPDGKDGPPLAQHVRYVVEVVNIVLGPWPASAKTVRVTYTVNTAVAYDKNGEVIATASPILPGSGIELNMKEGAEYLLCLEKFDAQDPIPLLRAEPLGNGWQILQAIGKFAATTRPATQEDEAADRGMGEEAVKLLTKGDYGAGLATADRAWQLWRNRYAGTPQPRMTASGLVSPPYDPTKTYQRPPSQAVADAAKAILDLLYANSNPKMVGPLLEVRTPELAEHAYKLVMGIGMQMCKDGRAGEGIKTIFAAQRAMESRIIEPDTREWGYPRLAKREPGWHVLRGLQAALTGNDPRELLAGYRAILPDEDKGRLAQMVVHVAACQPIPPNSTRSTLVVEAALDDKRPALRKLAADLLDQRFSHSFDRAAVTAVLRKHIDDPDARVRFRVARALVTWGDGAGLKPLMASTLTDFGDYGIPLGRIGRMGARSATDWIVRMGTKYPGYRRQESVRALWVLGDPAAIDYLGKILLDTREDELTRVLAAGALGATMDDKAFPFMAKALESAEGKLAHAIVTHLTEIRPALSFPVLCKSMQKMGILDGKDNSRRNLGIAWGRLQSCSGYGDVVGQYFKDKTKLQAGMQEYWDGRRKLHALASQIQYHRYIVPDRAKEQAARRELAEAKRQVPARCLDGWSGPAIPASQPAAAGASSRSRRSRACVDLPNAPTATFPSGPERCLVPG